MKKRILRVLVSLRAPMIYVLCNSLSGMSGVANTPDPTPPRRIVFLGDSITDGNTYPTLIVQALSEAGKPVPIATNAGIGGDTSKGMVARLQEDVLRYKPDLMTFSAGVNDVSQGIKPDEYAHNVETIVDTATKAGIEVLLLTTIKLGDSKADANVKLDQFNASLLAIAQKHKLRVAQVNELMKERGAGVQKLFEADNIHPNFEGQRLIARAVLDALDHKDVPVPVKLNAVPFPGVITPWKMRSVDEKIKKPLTEESVSSIANDAASGAPEWMQFTLPESAPGDGAWLEQERQRGFAVAAEKVLGKTKGYYIGVATVDSEIDKTVCFNTGASLQSLWVNGKKEYQKSVWRGWHAGRDRLMIPLHKGSNVIVIETGNQFFLSVTDNDLW